MSWDVLHRIGLRLRPLNEWPNNDRPGSLRSPFKASVTDTTKMLAKELNELRARNAILELAVVAEDLRQDGLPKSTARLANPGVILSMDTKFGPLRIYFNKFSDWKDNLRAIAFHLEHLRKAGMYGVGRDGEQYVGWKTIAKENADESDKSNSKKKKEKSAPKPSTSPLAQAVAFLSRYSDMKVNRETVIAAYRKCALRLHPDAMNGSHDLFIALQKAREVAYRHWHLRI